MHTNVDPASCHAAPVTPVRAAATDASTGVAAALPLWKVIAYGLGSFASTLMTTSIVTWLMYYASESHVGSAHGLFGLAMAVGRIADALADPYVGRWSDQTRTWLGRRLPFVLGGVVPMALLYILLWLPYTGEATIVRALRLGITLSAFFTLYTVVVCPYLAMLPEIATDGETRIRLATWQAGGSIAGGAAMILLTPRLLDEIGFQSVAVVVASVTVACYALVGIAFWRGPRREAPARVAAEKGWSAPLQAALRLITRERAFGMYLLGVASLWIGLNIVSISLPYMVTVLLGRHRAAIGAIGLLNVIGTVAMVPWIGRVVARYGKVQALRGAALLLCLALPLIALGRGGVWVAVVCSGPGLALVYTLPHPLLAEITDRHRRRYGDGEEALHFGAQGVALKGALALAAWVTGVLFAQLGAGPDAAEGIRAAAVLAGALSGVSVWVLGRVGRELKT
jgi:GPH family glycoside/pentoside/hexuronide:cation symporter